MSVIEDNNFYQFNCPHCNQSIEVQKKQLNCRIFRCGILKSNGKQIGPHTKKVECDRLKENNLIKAAEAYIEEKDIEMECRFDIISIILK